MHAHPARTGRVCLIAAAALLLFAPGALAQRFAAITGQLNRGGYTVIAVAYNGRATTVRARTGSFKLVPPAGLVTLQLRAANGLYAGPVVVGGGGKRVILGVKAGATLGRIRVLKGYAALAHPLATALADTKRWALAKQGVPLGNGRNFGLVRSAMHNGPAGPGGDSSRTGVPNELSIDADGDGRIDAISPARTKHGPLARPADAGSNDGFQIFSQLLTDAQSSVNADASSITTAQIDATMARWLSLYMQVVPGDVTNLDCGGLTYCSPGGTGHLYVYPGSGIQPTCSPSTPGCNYNEGPAFPACCDANGDGFGDLPQNANSSQARAFGLLPEADSSSIGSGDVLIERVMSGGVTTQVPSAIKFVFISEPALESWSSGSDSATVSYPIAAGGPGTQMDPWLIGGGSGDVVLTFKFWRPQRNGIAGAGEPQFMDIGHLGYMSRPVLMQPGANALRCPASSYSTSDPNLAVKDDGAGGGSVVDQAGDAPANSANTLSYSLDLTACFAANGQTLASGDQLAVDVSGRSPTSGDNAGTNYTFQIR